jgi:hypothetical protein
MARLLIPIVTLALALAALSAAPSAHAQTFETLFDNLFKPPRPPADVPDARRVPPPVQREPYYPRRDLPPPRSDLPPEQPLPAPMNLPPQDRPGHGTIQSQDLAPPPGTEPTNEANVPAQGQPQDGFQQGLPQQGQQGQPGAQQPATLEAPQDEVVVAPPPQRINNQKAVFAGLDKITGRIISFDVAIDETVQFGALQVTPKACYSRPPTEAPQTDSFVEVDEVTLQGEIKRIFTGWMFAASPGLHAVEHPIYDIWLTDCRGGGDQPAVATAAGVGQITGGDGEPVDSPPTPPRRPASAPPAEPQPGGFQPILRQ